MRNTGMSPIMLYSKKLYKSPSSRSMFTSIDICKVYQYFFVLKYHYDNLCPISKTEKFIGLIVLSRYNTIWFSVSTFNT